MPMQTIEQIMTKYGNYQMFQKEHQRFKADKTENKNHLADTTTEYLYRRNRIRNSRPTHKMRRDKIWKNTVSFGKQENKSDPHG